MLNESDARNIEDGDASSAAVDVNISKNDFVASTANNTETPLPAVTAKKQTMRKGRRKFVPVKYVKVSRK